MVFLNLRIIIDNYLLYPLFTISKFKKLCNKWNVLSLVQLDRLADLLEHLFNLWTVPLPLLLALSAAKLLILVIHILLAFEKPLLDRDHVAFLSLTTQVV